MVDVEADGPVPGQFSMISLGAVLVEPGLLRTFYATFRPVTDNFEEEALQVCGYTRAKTLTLDDPAKSIAKFGDWVKANSKGQPQFISDNNGFDWPFVNWYFHKFVGGNPFGHSSTNLGSLYKGLVKDTFQNFKHLRKTKHTHNPVDDAKGNAEALLAMKDTMGLKISWE